MNLADQRTWPITPQRKTLLVCNLVDKKSALRSIRIATSLAQISGRDVMLISEGRAADEAGVGDAVESCALDRLATYDVFIAIEREERVALGSALISVLCKLRLTGVKRINPRGKVALYRRPGRNGAKRALFLYPGIFVPPRIGSHQRAFSTILDLIEAGYDVDVIVKRSGSKLMERVAPYFGLIATDFDSYGTARPGEPDSEQTPEVSPRPQHGVYSLGERIADDVNDALRDLLTSRLADTTYQIVLVTFPWMVHALDGLPLNGAKLVCDTHDVVSNRYRQLSEAPPPSNLAEADALLEQTLLSRCDVVLATSRSDAKLFQTKLNLSNVVIHPIGFYPNETLAAWRNLSAPLKFGFIGSDMEANRRALVHVMTKWWPIIETFSPRSQIVIAGSVANSPKLSQYFILRENVIVAGPVPHMSQFFSSIDVLLSPTVVQGGVNVKNVEALLYRRPVITNMLGARMMLPLKISTRCETPHGLLSILRKLDRCDPVFAAALDRLFDQATEQFGKSARLEWA